MVTLVVVFPIEKGKEEMVQNKQEFFCYISNFYKDYLLSLAKL